jgi:hypothetical protein
MLFPAWIGSAAGLVPLLAAYVILLVWISFAKWT